MSSTPTHGHPDRSRAGAVSQPWSRGAGSATRPKSRKSRTPTHGHPDRSRTGASAEHPGECRT
eukprot:5513476-Alexandrium_andersonii.AAC.1